jgi:flavin-dependent dehydrogenase
MRQAIESGVLAAGVVAAGIGRGATYEEMKYQYESEWTRRWGLRRAVGAGLRRFRKYFGAGLRLSPAWVIKRIWD